MVAIARNYDGPIHSVRSEELKRFYSREILLERGKRFMYDKTRYMPI